MKTLVTVVLLGLVLGCRGECDGKPCARVDRDAQAGDYVVELDTSTAFVHHVIDGHESDSGLRAGDLVFTTDDPACVASRTSPCKIVVERLRLELGSAKQPTTEGTTRLDNLVVSVRAPVELVDEGFGYVFSSGQTRVQTCVSVEGTGDSALAALAEPVSMNLDIPNQTFSLDGTFPLRYRIDAEDCDQHDATATVIASGRKPFAQTP